MISQKEFTLPPYQRGIHLITHKILEQLPELPQAGILHVFIKHTSAALTINENADPSVRDDFNVFLSDLVPDSYPKFTHTIEGHDDMSAHIKSSLMSTSLTIPISNKRLNLGTWQGIFLCEFRNSGGQRKIVITIYE